MKSDEQSIEGVPRGHRKVIEREGEVLLRRVGPFYVAFYRG
jgi:hypothetical protein